MLDEQLLNAFDEQAAKYQPPLREPTDDDYSAVQDGVVLVCGGTLKPQPIDWIWATCLSGQVKMIQPTPCYLALSQWVRTLSAYSL
jgi:hypothetical protein